MPVDLDGGGNVEARAREARYAAAREHAAGRPIATGHTLTDQAETVVYRLASSSGVRALSGDAAPQRRPGPAAAVPDRRRDAGVVPRGGLRPREDDTNADTRLRRNLIRHEVMPALRRVHPGAEAEHRSHARSCWPSSTSC